MKKILSFVLVLAMIASMMCISVSAAAAADLAYDANGKIGASAADDGRADLVGSHHGQGQGSIEDGEASFNPKTHSANVDATLNAVVNHRYAVEIYYHVSDITVNGDATWDVNELEYVNNLTYKSDYQTAENKKLDDTVAQIQVADFTLVNYSDRDVYVSVTPALVANTCLSTSIDADESSAGVLAAAYNKNGTDGNTAKTNTYDVYLTCEDWARAFAQLDGLANGANTFTVASLTISVSTTPPTQNNG